MEEKLCMEWLLQLLAKDANTYEHSLRVGELCRIMALHLELDEKQTKQLVQGGKLHDIGKILIADEILRKDCGLSKEEWKIMKQHASLGAELINVYEDLDKDILDIINFHHERWNGSGYPDGLSGEDIPDFARICSILDSFDCMVSDRPYRKGMTFTEAKEELLRHSGTQFDKKYVDIFIHYLPSFEVIYSDHKIHI